MRKSIFATENDDVTSFPEIHMNKLVNLDIYIWYYIKKKQDAYFLKLLKSSGHGTIKFIHLFANMGDWTNGRQVCKVSVEN